MSATERVVAGWVLEQKLGSGGFGEVWRARRRHVDLVRALKLVPVADERTFATWRHEISRLEELSHPNIVRFYDADIVSEPGPYGEHAWIATELCERSLADELAQRPDRRLSLAETTELVDGMLAALATAHNADCVHRDMKPANILLHASGTWKLCDFGTARLIPAGHSQPHTVVVGTSPYMSPAAHRGLQDKAADLYALGVTVHEALCGQRLHPRPAAMSDSEYIKLILDTPPKISSELDDVWRYLVEALVGLQGPQQADELLAWWRQVQGRPAPLPVTREEPALPPTATAPAAPPTSTSPPAPPTKTAVAPEKLVTPRRAERTYRKPMAVLLCGSLAMAGFLLYQIISSAVLVAGILGAVLVVILLLVALS